MIVSYPDVGRATGDRSRAAEANAGGSQGCKGAYVPWEGSIGTVFVARLGSKQRNQHLPTAGTRRKSLFGRTNETILPYKS